MATYEHTLRPILNRRRAPFASYKVRMAGNDHMRVYGGWNLDVPCVWSVHYMYMTYTASADVANRIMRLTTSLEAIEMIHRLINTAITASEVKKLQLLRESGFNDILPYGDFYATLGQDSLTFSGDDQLHMYFSGGKAGDTVDILFQFKYRNWDLGMDPPLNQEVAQGEVVKAKDNEAARAASLRRGWFW